MFLMSEMEDIVAAEAALLQEQKEGAAEQVMVADLLSQHAAPFLVLLLL
jgi:hypothetical protein